MIFLLRIQIINKEKKNFFRQVVGGLRGEGGLE